MIGNEELLSLSTKSIFWMTLETIHIFSARFGKVLDRSVASELADFASFFLLLPLEAEAD